MENSQSFPHTKPPSITLQRHSTEREAMGRRSQGMEMLELGTPCNKTPQTRSADGVSMDLSGLHPPGTEGSFIQLARGAAELAENHAGSHGASSPGAAACQPRCSPHYLASAAALPQPAPCPDQPFPGLGRHQHPAVWVSCLPAIKIAEKRQLFGNGCDFFFLFYVYHLSSAARETKSPN